MANVPRFSWLPRVAKIGIPAGVSNSAAELRYPSKSCFSDSIEVSMSPLKQTKSGLAFSAPSSSNRKIESWA